MFQQLQNGWIPPEHISEEEYIAVRDHKENYPDYYVGYIGFNACFGAKYFSGYARDKKGGRDESNEAYRNLMKQLPNIMDVEFICGNYYEMLPNIKDFVIYCDPPYENTTKYSTKKFDYEKFWNWCREKSKNNFVFISSYDAPDDFKCIWNKEQTTSLDCNRGDDRKKKLRVEKLFTI